MTSSLLHWSSALPAKCFYKFHKYEILQALHFYFLYCIVKVDFSVKYTSPTWPEKGSMGRSFKCQFFSHGLIYTTTFCVQILKWLSDWLANCFKKYKITHCLGQMQFFLTAFSFVSFSTKQIFLLHVQKKAPLVEKINIFTLEISYIVYHIIYTLLYMIPWLPKQSLRTPVDFLLHCS